MAIVGLCARNEALELDRAGALVRGYQRMRKLEDSEKDSLKNLAVCAAAATSTWRLWKYRIESPSNEMANEHLKMVRLAEWIKKVKPGFFQAEVFG